MQGYDCQATVLLNMVVRTDGGEELARKIARRFAEKLIDSIQTESGDKFGEHQLTEFSLGDIEGEIDVDPFSDEEA